MNTTSSGCYVIDKDYNVIEVNQTARDIYPQLKLGKKCYKCLLDLDKPCGPCPVAGGRKGPNIYTDPIRGIVETVDAVEMEIPGHGSCHAMIFSTVGDLASFAATLPTSTTELHNLSMIKALTLDYYDVFSVNLKTDRISLYRHDGKAVEPESVYKEIVSYRTGIENYISRHVLAEDQEMMRKKNSLDHIRRQLEKRESFNVHYRVLLSGEIHYFFRKIARVGEADSFENIVIGVGCEDELVLSRQKNEMLLHNLSSIELDSRTGLYTREAFLWHAQELLGKYADKKFDFCIMKLENLGMINHQYGRPAGDRELALIGRLLKEYDDEYTCLTYMGDGTYASFTENLPQDIRKSRVLGFRDRIIQESRIKNVVAKWSVYVSPKRELTVEEIIDKTQFALSTIRANSHEDYVEFDQSMIDQMDWEAEIEKNFEQAARDREFLVWYQPKYLIKTGEIVGAEALVRWIRKDGTIIAPSEFIPVLENCGKIRYLDEYVFRHVCLFQKTLEMIGYPDFPISVNLSRASMFSEDLADQYAGIAGKAGVSPSNLPIEITESAAIRANEITSFAGALIKNGFALHMDDFGSGYSSLASLQTIPFASIKLDKTLIDNIGGFSGEALLKHTISFAKECGKTVIAEGVENFEQYMFLKIAGCDMIQGYYFSKPLSEETFLELLKSNI